MELHRLNVHTGSDLYAHALLTFCKSTTLKTIVTVTIHTILGYNYHDFNAKDIGYRKGDVPLADSLQTCPHKYLRNNMMWCPITARFRISGKIYYIFVDFL